ncbi:Acetoacetate decarboxylase beta barrel domain protein [Cordyceps fumosorosea ARSEF 2679]|uniref:Acetoacetate decarboxylase beta barrel domain protein n=1 Tax=Cordyceps fumosorosea (strain ARSEF 2679) TaxID=1081104 RepID=A0A167LVQ9_CORFA|nr:Acetoacetate decarboxylase beta barrel domain protein [Cordyceps fumosorosea ARSEF 2679]OAA53577.1 Acetoacetate decarboxylase beta barrel domain protein [Cordyceps fumosorosea ARSEF 2679]
MSSFLSIAEGLATPGQLIDRKALQLHSIPSLGGLSTYLWPATRSWSNERANSDEERPHNPLWKAEFVALACDKWWNSQQPNSDASVTILYHCVKLLIHADIELLVGYFRHSLGKEQHSRFQLQEFPSVRAWLDSHNAAIATWHADSLLSAAEGFRCQERSTNDDMSPGVGDGRTEPEVDPESPHIPYAIYYATLVLWARQVTRRDNDAGLTGIAQLAQGQRLLRRFALVGQQHHATAGSDAKSQPLHFLVIGAGLGGLTAAIALRRAGQRVTVFEQSRLASEYGAAINVPPNANGILLHLGVDVAAAGAVELKMATTSPSGAGRPAELRVASRVADLDPQQATITLADGTVVAGDVIVGADGIHSTTRGKLTSVRPEPSGKSAFRFLLNRADVIQHPKIDPAMIKDGELIFWFHADRRIVVYPTRNNDIWNFVCIHPDRSWENDDSSWNRTGSQEDLLREYEGFDERALTLLRMADPSMLKVWRLMDMDTVEDWCSGRFCLLGDAAHPFLPHQGQGAAQAMEDAASLGVVFPAGTPASEVPARLKLYQQCRKVRAVTVQELTRQAGADIRGSEAAKKLDHMRELIQRNCGYDEHHNSIHQLRIWEDSNRPKRWRMPLSFGPASGPRQSLGPRRWSSMGSSFTSRTIRFKTSRTLLRNLLPSTSFFFLSPDSVAYASYVHTSLRNLDWLGGRGYDYIALLLHGVAYRKKDGSTVPGSFVSVMWENLTDPILTGREELGCPKLFCDIRTEHNANNCLTEASWAGGAPFLKMQMEGIRETNIAEAADDGALLFYKYIPATGRPGVADVEYPVCAPTRICQTVNHVQTAQTANIILDPLDEETLPTLHHIVDRLAEIPFFEVAEATVAEGVVVNDMSTAYRIE